jgi:hypothetical protein
MGKAMPRSKFGLSKERLSMTSRRDKEANQPLRLTHVHPPESPEQFLSLAENEYPPIELSLNRPPTAYEKHELLERFPSAVVSVVHLPRNVEWCKVRVTLPYGRLRDTAHLIDEIAGISGAAAKLEAHHRERLYAYEEAANAINQMLKTLR